MYEVHIFSASARATANNDGAFKLGDRHPLLIMSRQPLGTDHDLAEAERRAAESGWEDFRFERAGTLIAENLNGKGQDFVEAFEHAMFGGCSVIAYRDVVTEDEDS